MEIHNPAEHYCTSLLLLLHSKPRSYRKSLLVKNLTILNLQCDLSLTQNVKRISVDRLHIMYTYFDWNDNFYSKKVKGNLVKVKKIFVRENVG